MFETAGNGSSTALMVNSAEIAWNSDANNLQQFDARQILTIKNDDGTETNYIPFHEDGQIVMTPITLIKEDTFQAGETEILEPSKNVDNLQGFLNKPSAVPKKPRLTPSYRKSLVGNGGQNLIRYGRKHQLVDAKTIINAKQFKHQLLYSHDLIKKIDLAPKSRRQMRNMVEGYTQLFAYPAHNGMSNRIRELYTRHCTSRNQPNSESIDDMRLLPVGHQVNVDTSQVKRITRKRKPSDISVGVMKKEDVSMDDHEPTEVTSDTNCLNYVPSQIVVLENDEISNLRNSVFDDSNVQVLFASNSDNEEANNYQVLIAGADVEDQENSQIVLMDENGQIYNHNLHNFTYSFV